MIQEPKTAGSWLRYSKESHTKLFRSLPQLRVVQAERRAAEVAAEKEESPAEESPAEAHGPSEAAAEGAVPNDPIVQDCESQEASESGTCDTDSGVNSETRYQAMMHALAILDAAGFAKPRSRDAAGAVSD